MCYYLEYGYVWEELQPVVSPFITKDAMQFSRREQFYQASHITGPKHNFLALTLTGNTSGTSAPTIESLPPVGTCSHRPLNPQQILHAVVEGVTTANTQFGTQFSVQHAQYLANDTGPESIYAFLALKIIEHVVVQGRFADTTFPFRS